jgi:hypothetical protein
MEANQSERGTLATVMEFRLAYILTGVALFTVSPIVYVLTSYKHLHNPFFRSMHM